VQQRIVTLDGASVRARFRAPACEHEWIVYPETAPEDVLQRLQGATIAVVNKVDLEAGLLTQLPALRMIAIAATGADNVDLEACRRLGIVVSNVRGYAVHSVPEHVLALILALRRRLFEYAADVRAGRWQQVGSFCFFDHRIADLHGSTLAIVGGGSLGQGVARLGSAFGMRVILAERRGVSIPRPGRVAFATALAEADVLSLHCPLTAETRHLIGAPELAAMRPGAILINTARGGLVDGEALAAALRAGTLGGAGIDVLPVEPPSHGDPLLAGDIPNLIVTPHVAWASEVAMQTLADQVVDNLEAFVNGAPRNRLA
jgi:glycerate dehydrogenase